MQHNARNHESLLESTIPEMDVYTIVKVFSIVGFSFLIASIIHLIPHFYQCVCTESDLYNECWGANLGGAIAH